MKRSHLLFALLLAAAVPFIGLSSAGAETFTGKVAAMTKGSKSTMIEIISDAAGNPPAYRCTVSTTFQEIADMLLQAMESKTPVTVTSSDSCKMDGMLRDCGSIVTVEAVRK